MLGHDIRKIKNRVTKRGWRSRRRQQDDELSPSSAGSSGSDETIEVKGEELGGGKDVLSSLNEVVKCSAEEDDANGDERHQSQGI